MSSHTVEFFHDFASPFSYLASTQLEALCAECDAALIWHPMLLGAVFKQVGTPDVPLMGMSEAKRRYKANEVTRDLLEQGVFVLGASRATVVEEVPQAYKDAAQVVDVVQAGGLAEKVVRLRPLGCVKG